MYLIMIVHFQTLHLGGTPRNTTSPVILLRAAGTEMPPLAEINLTCSSGSSLGGSRMNQLSLTNRNLLSLLSAEVPVPMLLKGPRLH